MYRSRLRAEFSEVDTSGWKREEGLFGPFGVKKRSARVTERSVRALRVREGVGGNRSRVRESCGCHRGTGERRAIGAELKQPTNMPTLENTPEFSHGEVSLFFSILE